MFNNFFIDSLPRIIYLFFVEVNRKSEEWDYPI